MPNPFRQNPQDSRLARIAQLSQIAAQQDEQERQQQDALMRAQLQQFQLQQEQQMGPERLRALQQENLGREQQNAVGASNAAWQEPMMQQKYATGLAAQKEQELKQSAQQQSLDWQPTMQRQAYKSGQSQLAQQDLVRQNEQKKLDWGDTNYGADYAAKTAEANSFNARAGYENAAAAGLPSKQESHADMAKAAMERSLLAKAQAMFYIKQMGLTPEQETAFMSGAPVNFATKPQTTQPLSYEPKGPPTNNPIYDNQPAATSPLDFSGQPFMQNPPMDDDMRRYMRKPPLATQQPTR